MANYLIIGGSSGIGYALANQLKANQHNIIATYNKSENFSKDEAITYYKCNVLDEDLNFDYLPNKIDGLIYCPGSINLKPFNRLEPQDFVEDFQLQVVGVIKVIQAVLPRLKVAENPSIVCFSTVAVQMGFNFHTQVATSKGALEGLIRSLAAELAPKIRVNGIALSLIDTPLAASLLSNEEKKKSNAQRHPLKRIGEPEDAAHMAEFLLSDKSGWITGQIMHVDGGMSSIRM